MDLSYAPKPVLYNDEGEQLWKVKCSIYALYLAKEGLEKDSSAIILPEFQMFECSNPQWEAIANLAHSKLAITSQPALAQLVGIPLYMGKVQHSNPGGGIPCISYKIKKKKENGYKSAGTISYKIQEDMVYACSGCKHGRVCIFLFLFWRNMFVLIRSFFCLITA